MFLPYSFIIISQLKIIKLLQINKNLHEKENPINIHSKITKKYFISLKTATSISIINANPENALKYKAIFIQLKINAKEPNILTTKISLSN